MTWKKSDADLDSSGTINGLFALATAPGMPGTVFASVFRHFWKSSDGATTFAKSGTGLPLARVQTVVADAKGTTLWLGTEGEGVWRSTDGGATWTESRAGMGAVNVQALHADAAIRARCTRPPGAKASFAVPMPGRVGASWADPRRTPM